MNQFPRGAKPSPRHKAFAAPAHRPIGDIPDSFGVIPPKLSPWGNYTYGDCVTAEEAAAKAQYALMNGQPETFVSEQTVVAWAAKYGYLNGASLTDVMDTMIRYGIKADDGQTYFDGPYHSVDWTNDATLSSAIYQGPVKIAVAADQLQNALPSNLKNGWIATGFKRDGNTDHCGNLCGFGSLAALCSLLKIAVPPRLDPATRCYLLFTWGTVGIIDRQSLLAITSEAWLRTPTTPGLPTPTPAPQPQPTPQPTPVPVVNGGLFLVDNNHKVIYYPADWTPALWPKPAGASLSWWQWFLWLFKRKPKELFVFFKHPSGRWNMDISVPYNTTVIASAVERDIKGTAVVPSGLQWTATGIDGINLVPSADTLTAAITAPGPGTITVTCTDPAFGLTGTGVITETALPPSSLSITFTAAPVPPGPPQPQPAPMA